MLLLCLLGSMAAGTMAAAGADARTAGLQDAMSKGANAGISIMLLGSVSFIMGLFYLVNHHDKDMVKYCWQVISSTISIFSAVLLFQAVNGCVERCLLEGAPEGAEVAVGMAHFLAWFAGLQALLAYLSGALAQGVQERSKEVEDLMERRMKSYAILMGHIAGFAAINAFGTLQQQMYRDLFPVTAIAPMTWVVLYILSEVVDHARDAIAVSDDGVYDRAEELWDEVAEETEDDIIGLAVSFLIVQACRFGLTGRLPNAEGEDEEGPELARSDRPAFAFLSIGFSLAMLEFFRTVRFKHTFHRSTRQLRNVIMMCFAWCIFYSMDWLVSRHIFVAEHGMMQEVTLALVVTTFSFSGIFLLDKIADMPATQAQTDHAIRSVVRAFGILIGFSWEKAFDGAVSNVAGIAKSVMPQEVTKLVMALSLSALVVPAWRHFILPTIISYEKQDEEAEAEKAPEHAECGEAQAVGGALALPLLGKAPANGAPDASATETEALRRQCERYRGQVGALEARNARLEASMAEFMEELGGLRRAAESLKRCAPTR